jgi:hypothetical protein
VSERIASALRLRRSVHVVDSDLVGTPIVLGWLRPVVLLPIAAFAHLTPAQIEAILAHELAHVRRHDYFVNLLQTVAETLLFYHPAVWRVSARIRAEREHCCDDMAVVLCGDALSYATALAAIERARISLIGRTEQGGFALAATGGFLLDRIRRVLHVPVDSERSSSSAVLTTVIVLLLILWATERRLLSALAQTVSSATLEQPADVAGPAFAMASIKPIEKLTPQSPGFVCGFGGGAFKAFGTSQWLIACRLRHTRCPRAAAACWCPRVA